jgi:hypothetical protein
MNTARAISLIDGRICPEDEGEMLDAWQYIYDNGLHVTLPGRYGRALQDLIDSGYIAP